MSRIRLVMLLTASIVGSLSARTEALLSRSNGTPIIATVAREKPTALFVFDLSGNGHSFTDLAHGVTFDLDGSGARVRTAWTSIDDDDVFLTLDLNKDGAVTSAAELLGNRWIMANGERVASGLDCLVDIQGFPIEPRSPAPAGIGTINQSDRVFSELRAWNDANHNGRSEPSELKTLAEVGINRILLGFRRLPATPDANGNRSLLDGSFYVQQRGMQLLRHMTEVEFAK